MSALGVCEINQAPTIWAVGRHITSQAASLTILRISNGRLSLEYRSNMRLCVPFQTTCISHASNAAVFARVRAPKDHHSPSPIGCLGESVIMQRMVATGPVERLWDRNTGLSLHSGEEVVGRGQRGCTSQYAGHWFFNTWLIHLSSGIPLEYTLLQYTCTCSCFSRQEWHCLLRSASLILWLILDHASPSLWPLSELNHRSDRPASLALVQLVSLLITLTNPGRFADGALKSGVCKVCQL